MKKKFNFFVAVFVVLIAILLFFVLSSSLPETVKSDRMLGLYKTKYLASTQVSFMKVPLGDEMKVLEVKVKANDYTWEGAVKVQYKDQIGWIYFKYLDDESRSAIIKASRF